MNPTTLNGQWIEVFRAGDYGTKGKFTAADLDRVVANYDPAKHEAPVTLGHPEHDGPAYGWVEEVRRDGETLSAKLKQVPAEFEQLVRDGRFKKRSIALTGKPGQWRLRHIGFLGAMPPEVKGLADVKLCEFGQEEFQAIEFTEDCNMEKSTFMEALKEFFRDFKFNAGGEQKTFSEADVNAAIEKASAKFEDKYVALEKKFNDAATQNSVVANDIIAERAMTKLKAAGKWLPAFDKMGAPQLFHELAGSTSKITFGEGDKKTEKTAVEVFADFLGGLKEIVPAGDITAAAAAAKKGGKVLQMNETDRIKVDLDSVQFDEACTKRAAEKKIPYGDAMRELRGEGWQPTQGTGTGGEV